MKFSIKSIDYKKLAINHAEKIIVGLIGLLVVLIVFMPLFAGKFSGYDKTPEALTKKAAETHEQILASQWPDSETIQYQGTDDLAAKIDDSLRHINPGEYDRTIEIAPPLYHKKEPRKEPDWLTVIKLLVSTGRGHFEVPSKVDPEELSPEGTDKNGEGVIPLANADDKSEIPAQYRRKGGSGNIGAGGPMGPGAGGPMGPGGGPGGRADRGRNSNKQASGPPEGMMAGMMDAMGGTGGGSGGAAVEGRGQRYALLRGIFNIRTQLERIADALSLSEVELNPQTTNFEILGFEVARKEGTGPWDKVEDHQILDIKRSMQVLKEMSGFDFDPVPLGVTHQQITSPLPRRIVGEWDEKEVAHPEIDDYMLTPEGKDLKEFLTDYLAGQEEKDQKLKDLSKKDTEFGFADVQPDARGLTNQVFGGGSGQSSLQDFSKGFQNANGPGAGGPGGPGMMVPSGGTRPGRSNNSQMQQIKSAVDSITAAGTLLLFRYFDFDVEPGKTYQYRVRLIFQNPNFNVAVSNLENPASREGEIRKTPWSELAKPITVLKDTEYFLTKVSVPAGKKSEASSLLMYQWKPDIGTVISSVLDSKLGQYIGGEKVTQVLKPTIPEFATEKAEFTSEDLLVDSSQGVDVNSKDHADLNLPKRLTAKGRLRIMDEALVQDSFGRMFSIDPFSSSTEKQDAKERFDWQNQPWQFLKEQSKDGGLEDGMAPEDMMQQMMGNMMSGGAKKSKGRRGRFRRKNKLKKESK
jgi:hypothetical protein